MRPPVETPSMKKPAIARGKCAGERCGYPADLVVVKGGVCLSWGYRLLLFLGSRFQREVLVFVCRFARSLKARHAKSSVIMSKGIPIKTFIWLRMAPISLLFVLIWLFYIIKFQVDVFFHAGFGCCDIFVDFLFNTRFCIIDNHSDFIKVRIR